MPDMTCQNCGMPNAEEQTKCSFCGEPLQPAAQDTSSIPPGQAPTKKTTAELEPILPQWLRDARQQAREIEQQDSAEEARLAAENPAPPAQDSPVDFLAGLAATARQDDTEEIPDWMRGVPGTTPPPRVEKNEDPLSRRQEIRWEQEPVEEEAPSQPSALEVPAWMRAEERPDLEKQEVLDWLTRKDEVASAPVESTPPTSAEGALSWMDSFVSDPPTAETKEAPASAPADFPDWLTSASGVQPPAEADSIELALPAWIQQAEQAPPTQPAGPEIIPDWLAAIKPTESAVPGQVEPNLSFPKTAAFVDDDESSADLNDDDLFAVNMPDWLANISPNDKTASESVMATDAPSAPPSEEIIPASLPSWVQAMRPVENVLPGLSHSGQPRESEGPLAGLLGVLPAAPGFAPSGRPKALSIRLQPSEAQQTGAALLEHMLEAEAHPRPMRSASLAASQRTLRWAIAGFLILIVGMSLLFQTRLVPLPTLPEEAALGQSVVQGLPEGAPVLVIFDYEPALAAELEASAAAYIDSLIGLRRPGLTLLSTSITGPALAEHFFAKTQARHGLVRGQDFVNLGYLAGGTAGILAFAENSRLAMPFNSAWDGLPLQNINSIADYSLIILLTDQSETARAWVEQTGAARAVRPLVVISSAQAAPMIQPYLLSGQINGLIVGLRAGAGFESASPEFSGPARQYWDAYNLALLGAWTLILLGAAWNGFNSARARRTGLEEA